jgi:hypothetical protein
VAATHTLGLNHKPQETQVSREHCESDEKLLECEKQIAELRNIAESTMFKLHSGEVPADTTEIVFVGLMTIFIVLDKALSLPAAHEECPHLLRLQIANAIGHIIEQVDALAFGAGKVPPPDLSSLLQ